MAHGFVQPKITSSTHAQLTSSNNVPSGQLETLTAIQVTSSKESSVNSQPSSTGSCSPEVIHAQVALSKVVVCQHSKSVGSGSCSPMTVQAQVASSNAVVCQHSKSVGSGSCSPEVIQAQVASSNAVVCQHSKSVGSSGNRHEPSSCVASGL